ncbi:unnamed protein product, partial [Musa acuminata subsp. burmannicoides]
FAPTLPPRGHLRRFPLPHLRSPSKSYWRNQSLSSISHAMLSTLSERT